MGPSGFQGTAADVGRPVLVRLQDVSKSYDMGEVRVTALAPTNLDIYEGEFLVILGPSGSGKSTLLNLIGGMDRPSTGRILFRGRDLTAFDEQALTAYRRDEVGVIFQFFSLLTSLTALENVALAAEVVGDRALDPWEALRLVGLEARAHHFPAQLSGGEQQRVAIARALVKNPSLILCDEPTGSLDAATGRQVLILLHELQRRQGKTVVVITHNAPIARMGDRVVYLRSGTVDRIDINPDPTSPEEITW